ncbi:ABC transporter substrate-binding protein [Roseiarcaceae bacterium H3SJ34-1]|uniref:ABC transporter substrate-binding protein n=1 Tax=Terripilifer ovatus TaxID=3032367 RepID=UPI003AB92353|nr:ABC transporter substrate-binding protein [Roseiarcaceae bacterium H3SJ34-1]
MSKAGFFAACCFALATFCTAVSTRAAEPYRINVLLPLTGGGSFQGKGGQQTLQVLQADINKSGGVNGQPVEFVYHDDQTSPQIAVQLARAVISQKPSVMMGSSLVAMCSAIAPLLKSGPFDYCMSPGMHPPAGSFQFTPLIDTRDLMDVMLRYFRLRGWTKVAFISSTDASGQEAERGFDETLKKPEHSDIVAVERQRFNPSDVSVSAQIERIKAANPQVVIAWSSGGPIATIFKAAIQSGLDTPIATTYANQTFAQMDQYKDFLPKELYIATSIFPPHDGLYQLDPAVEAEQREFYAVHRAAGIDPDSSAIAVWDPAKIIISALRKLGAKASAEEVRAYVAGLTGYAGVNGLYDFKATPQRGLSNVNAVMTRWDASKRNWIPVSKPTGFLLDK